MMETGGTGSANVSLSQGYLKHQLGQSLTGPIFTVIFMKVSTRRVWLHVNSCLLAQVHTHFHEHPQLGRTDMLEARDARCDPRAVELRMRGSSSLR